MAKVCYASTGSNTAPYETWAKAATLFETALAAATAGDDIQVDMTAIASADAELSGSKTWTVPTGATVHIGTQSGADGITLGDMGTTYWFGNSTVGRQVTLLGSCRVLGGLTIRQHGSSALQFNQVDGNFFDIEKLTFWNSSTSASGSAQIGTNNNSRTRIGTLVLKWDRTSGSFTSGLGVANKVEIGDLQVISAGVTLSGLIDDRAGTLAELKVLTGDISQIGSGSVLVNDAATGTLSVYLNNVILPASYVPLASQTQPAAGAEVTLTDCSVSGGGTVPFLYANAYGDIRIDTGIYLTAGAAGHSAKITTTSICTPVTPFWTPWFREYKAAATVNLSSEVLRDGSASAYTDAQFWKETLTKETSSSVALTARTTRSTGTNIPAGADTGSWTGESGTAWSGEITIDSVVLAEDGFVQQRFGAGVASSVLYVDIGPIS